MKKIMILSFIFILLITIVGCQDTFVAHYLKVSEKKEYLEKAVFSFDGNHTYRLLAAADVHTSITEDGMTEFFDLDSSLDVLINWSEMTDNHQASGSVVTDFHIGKTDENEAILYDRTQAIDASFGVHNGFYYADAMINEDTYKFQTTRPIIDQEAFRYTGFDIGAFDDYLLHFFQNSIDHLIERVYQEDEHTYAVYFNFVSMDYSLYIGFLQTLYSISDDDIDYLLEGTAKLELLAKIIENDIISISLGISTSHQTEDQIYSNYFQLKFTQTDLVVNYPEDIQTYGLKEGLMFSDYIADLRFHVGEDYPYHVYVNVAKPDLNVLMAAYQKPGYVIEGYYFDKAFTERITRLNLAGSDQVLYIDIFVHFVKNDTRR